MSGYDVTSESLVRWAAHRINSDSTILPNVSLEVYFHISDVEAVYFIDQKKDIPSDQMMGTHLNSWLLHLHFQGSMWKL